MEGLEFERSLRLQEPRLQFPHGDYIPLLHSFASDLKISAPDSDRFKFVIPAGFSSNPATLTPEAELIFAQLNAEVEASKAQGKWVSASVFRNLEGSWKYKKSFRIKNKNNRGKMDSSSSRRNSIPASSEGIMSFSPVLNQIQNIKIYSYSSESEKGFYSYDAEKDELCISVLSMCEDSDSADLKKMDFILSEFSGTSEGWTAGGAWNEFNLSSLFTFDGIYLDSFETVVSKCRSGYSEEILSHTRCERK
jgi:hypothetical protein